MGYVLDVEPEPAKQPEEKTKQIESFSEEMRKKLAEKFPDRSPAQLAQLEQAVFDARKQLENTLAALADPDFEWDLNVYLTIWFKSFSDETKKALREKCQRDLDNINKIITTPDQYLRDVRTAYDDLADMVWRSYSDEEKKNLREMDKKALEEKRVPLKPEDKENVDKEWARIQGDLWGVVYGDNDPEKRMFIGENFWNASETPSTRAGTIRHEVSHLDDVTPTGDTVKIFGSPTTIYAKKAVMLSTTTQEALELAAALEHSVGNISYKYTEYLKKKR